MPIKPFKSYEEQLQVLNERGLLIENKAEALHTLEHHNYYRISAYRFPFQDAPDHFKKGTTFAQLWELYCFDRALRQLTNEACKALEISVRARWAHVLGGKYGAHAYENPSVFRSGSFYQNNLSRLDEELNRSQEAFISHYRTQHNLQRPPIWAACEVMSFGLLSRFYDCILRMRDKKEIASTYQLSVSGFRSLLQQSVYLRNLSAHHSRLWNRRLTVNLSLPTKQPAGIISSLNLTDVKRIYNSLILLGHIHSLIAPKSDWKQRLQSHLETLNGPSHSDMGFPNDWRERDFWKDIR